MGRSGGTAFANWWIVPHAGLAHNVGGDDDTGRSDTLVTQTRDFRIQPLTRNVRRAFGRVLPALALLLLAGCAAMHPQQQPGGAGQSPPASASNPALRLPAAPPARPLDPAEALEYHVMAGELAAGRGDAHQAAQQLTAAVALHPDPRLAAQATAMALAAGDQTLALQAARAWQKSDPDSFEATEAVAGLALQAGDTETAYHQFKAMIAADPAGSGDGLQVVGRLLAQQSDRADAALALMKRLLADYPTSIEGQRAYALLALTFRRWPLAEQIAEAALKQKPGDTGSTLLLIATHVHMGHLARADRELDALAARKAKHAASLRLNYARLLLETRHEQRARSQIEQILKHDAKNTDAIFMLALLDLKEGHNQAARRGLQKLTGSRLHRNSAEYFLGRLAETRGDLQGALVHYQAVAGGSRAVDAGLRQAVVLGKLGRADEALQLLDDMQRQYPSQTLRLLLAQSGILLDAQRAEDSLHLLDAALQQDSDNADLRYARALTYEDLGQIDKAESDLHFILKRQPDNAQALNALGYVMTVHGRDLDQARKLIEKALKLDPGDPAVIDSLGWVHYRQGDAAGALPLLQKAYAGSAKDPEIGVHLGEVLWHLGHREQARAVFAAALKAAPHDQKLRQTVQQIEQ
jgi:Uncharacterized enzyme of heme biosynthesis